MINSLYLDQRVDTLYTSLQPYKKIFTCYKLWDYADFNPKNYHLSVNYDNQFFNYLVDVCSFRTLTYIYIGCTYQGQYDLVMTYNNPEDSKLITSYDLNHTVSMIHFHMTNHIASNKNVVKYLESI